MPYIESDETAPSNLDRGRCRRVPAGSCLLCRRDPDEPPRGGRYKREFGVPQDKAQDNFTDPDSRIMKRAGGGFDASYNAQTAVDAGDPINFIAGAVAARPVVLSQVINDTVVPNSATQRLIGAATFVKASAAGPTPVAAGTGTWVHFTSGSHGSLLSPAASLAVTTEMQTHAASLAATGGTAFVVANPGILEP